jgi:hypothetical protein
MATEETTHSIIHPVVDTMAIGGLSIAFLVFLLLFEPPWSTEQLAENFIVLTALFNWPHFMATYGLMYKSPETVKRYPWASIWIPLALIVTTAAAVTSQVVVGFEGSLKALTFMAGAYLAWHYTGQAWGMMASFSHLDGAGFKERERTWVRTGLRILLAWHVIWFLHAVDLGGARFAESSLYLTFYSWTTYTLIPLGAVVGGVGLYHYWKRIERTPSPRVLVPFLSIVLWYVMMALNPLAIFWVQISHAIQYLIFPIRVEMNRGAKEEKSPLRSGVLFVMLILGLGVATFELFPRLIDFAVPVAVLGAVKVGVGNFINIHHFFADGVIWKISNPAVRKELFSHIQR